jgi:hypothetical protein
MEDIHFTFPSTVQTTTGNWLTPAKLMIICEGGMNEI